MPVLQHPCQRLMKMRMTIITTGRITALCLLFSPLMSYPGFKIIFHRHSRLVVRVSASGAVGHGFDPWPRLTKVFKAGSSGFSPLVLRIMGIALCLACQCKDNGMVKYWLKIVWETWICELLPSNN